MKLSAALQLIIDNASANGREEILVQDIEAVMWILLEDERREDEIPAAWK